jgi:ribosomal protein S11
MASLAPALHLVPDVEPDTTVVLTAELEAAIDNIAALADDLEAGLDAVATRLWGDSRAAAINELNRMQLRIQRLRDDYAALTGRGPTKPRRVA